MKRSCDSPQPVDTRPKLQKNGESLVTVIKNGGGLEEIQEILKLNDFDIEERTEGKTALMYSLMNGNLDAVKLLISVGSEVGSQDSEGNTALLLACQNPDTDPELVQILLEHGAKVTDQTKSGNTPLILATMQGSVEIVRILLSAGANTEVVNNEGETALFKIRNEASLAVLLQAGANPEAISKNKTPVIIYIVKSFLSSTNLVDYLAALLKAGADPSSQDNQGYSLLSLTILTEQFDCVNLLLEKSINPSYKNEGGFSALYQAIFDGNFEIMKRLIESGANPSSQLHELNYSLLMLVCRYAAAFENNSIDIVEVAQYLIDSGANVSAKNYLGNSVLIYAVENQNVKLAKCLLSAGANPLEESQSGKSALSAVLETDHRNTELIDLVVTASTSSFSATSAQNLSGKIDALQHALENKRKDVIEKLLNPADYNIKAQNSSGKDILMEACELTVENNELVRVLIENGASLSAQDNNGKTALMLALRNQNLLILETLIRAGAKLSTQDNNGNTLLMIACNYGLLSVVKLLLKNHVPVLIKNKDGLTAAMIAAAKDRLDILCLLVEYGASVVDLDNDQNSVISYIVSNRLNDPFRPAYQQTLQKIINYKSGDISLVVEAVRTYLKIHNRNNYQDVLLIFKKFVKEVVKTASSNMTNDSTHLVRKVYDMAIMGWVGNEHQCFANRKDIFYIIAQSNFKNLNWTYQNTLTLCDAFQHMTENLTFHFETIGYIINLNYTENCWVIDQKSCEFYCTLFEKLVGNDFPVKLSHPKIMSPLSVLTSFRNHHPNEKYVLKMAKQLIKHGVQKCQYLLHFRDVNLEWLKHKLQLPDALWLAFQHGYSTLLPILIPYWSAPPLALLLFLPRFENLFPENNSIDYKSFETRLNQCLDVLVDISEPLPPCNPIIEPIQIYLDQYAQRRVNSELADTIAEKFKTLHSASPPSLKSMCRYVIRDSWESGDDLPQRLSYKVPPGLKKYITMRQ